MAVRSLRERGELKDIVELFGSVDENDDEGWHDLPLLVELARTYSLLGDEPRLEKFFVRCADLNPPRAALYHGQIGWHFHRKKRWARALTWYEKAIETFPSYHLALFRMGYCLERLHRPGAAAKALGMADEAYHSSSPEQRERARGIQVQTLFHLARNLSQTNRHEAGREALDRCADLDAHSLERVIRDEHWRSSYGNSYLREGKPQEALRWLEDALRLEPPVSGDLGTVGSSLRTVRRSAKGRGGPAKKPLDCRGVQPSLFR